MKIFEGLLPEEFEALSSLFQSEGYKALHKLLNNKIIGLGQMALQAKTMEEVAEYRGYQDAFRSLHEILKTAHQKHEKGEVNAKQKV
jgi:hypothetical protein